MDRRGAAGGWGGRVAGGGASHLEAGVHLEEVMVPVLIDNKLNRARRLVVDLRGESASLLSHQFPEFRRHEGARCLLDHLLVPALDRALPLPQVDRVAVGVGQHLRRITVVVLEREAGP